MPYSMLNAKLPDNDILAKIGVVAAEWSWLESLTNEFLANVCSADPGAMYVITQGSSHSSVMKWLMTLTEIKLAPPESRDVILNLFKEIDSAREERNTVVHGLWSAGDEAGFGYVQTLRWSRAEVAKSELWSISDLDGLIEQIIMHQTMLTNLMVNIGFLKVEK